MTDFETEYIFCKDNWLVLIVECLFAKASTANAKAELLKLRPLLQEQQLICIEATYSISESLGSFPKSENFNKLQKMICQVFWAKTYTLWGYQRLILHLVKRSIIGPL